jgi:hypothetical protein
MITDAGLYIPQKQTRPIEMGWRETFLLHLGPGCLGGITLGNWIKLLRENNFAVSPSCILRAGAISSQSLRNSAWAWFENRRYGASVEGTAILPPLFVLGHWRSGTTHLHNLLTTDGRFAFPNNYQSFYPHTFLSTEAGSSRLLELFFPKRRPMDNIEWDMRSPQEDEFALCVSSFKSPCMGWVFPRHRTRYDQYLTFRDVADGDIAEWQSALLLFLKKLTW